jgi:hypothetical protein
MQRLESQLGGGEGREMSSRWLVGLHLSSAHTPLVKIYSHKSYRVTKVSESGLLVLEAMR